MDNETYKALKRIMEQVIYIYEATESGIKGSDINAVENWIEETAKQHE